MKWHEEQTKATLKNWFYCDDGGQVVAWVCNHGPQNCYVYESSGNENLLQGRYMSLDQAKEAIERQYGRGDSGDSYLNEIEEQLNEAMLLDSTRDRMRLEERVARIEAIVFGFLAGCVLGGIGALVVIWLITVTP